MHTGVHSSAIAKVPGFIPSRDKVEKISSVYCPGSGVCDTNVGTLG